MLQGNQLKDGHLHSFLFVLGPRLTLVFMVVLSVLVSEWLRNINWAR